MTDPETTDDGGTADNDGDDRGWPDPPAEPWGPAADRYRLGIQLACAVATFLFLAWLTRGFLAEAVPRLWPPTEPTSQWATLVSLHAFGYVVVPLMVGSLLADLVLNRISREPQTE